MDKRNSFRMDKVNSEMQKVISSVINTELKNPELDDLVLTITEVHTAPDFSSAKVFVSGIGEGADRNVIIKELKESEGYIKKRIAEVLRPKRTPSLIFIYDDSIEEGDRIMRLLDSIKKEGKDV